MKLSNLLQEIITIDSACDREIKDLVQDSRAVKAGDLFFARPGTQMDGRVFIEAAIAQGAVAVLVEASDGKTTLQFSHATQVPIITLPNLTEKIGPIAARFFNYPARALTVIGVTGTNGKTSSTHFIAQSLTMAGFPCGIIGTLGSGFYGHLHAGQLTTPDAITLQRTLAELRDQGAKYVAMEVASHALVQKRVNGIDFVLGVFTNLTRDHLDYHGDMENYAQAKKLLMTWPGLRSAIINVDDAYGRHWVTELAGKVDLYTYSLNQPAVMQTPGIYVQHAELHQVGITATLQTPWGSGVVHNPYLIGRFNLSNLLAAGTVLNLLGMPFDSVLDQLGKVRCVPGRMEVVDGFPSKPVVVVDYAHTPDALEQALSALREHCAGKLWCVFGCGGNRDRGKRPLMAQIAEKYADRIVLTDDNPRHEDAREIIAEIRTGLGAGSTAVIEHDRRRAIAHALDCAAPDDTILIAGKGHETYQIVGDEKLVFSDVIETQLLLAESR